MAGYIEESRRAAFRAVTWQFLASLLAGAVGLLAGGPAAGGAAFMGGLVATGGSLVMALRVFGGRPERDPRRFLTRMVLGETLKFAATVLLFGVAIVVLKAAFLPLIMGYFASLFAYWAGLLVSNVGRVR